MKTLLRIFAIAMAIVAMVLTQTAAEFRYSIALLALSVLTYLVSYRFKSAQTQQPEQRGSTDLNKKRTTDTVTYAAAIGSHSSSESAPCNPSSSIDAGGCDGGGV